MDGMGGMSEKPAMKPGGMMKSKKPMMKAKKAMTMARAAMVMAKSAMNRGKKKKKRTFDQSLHDVFKSPF